MLAPENSLHKIKGLLIEAGAENTREEYERVEPSDLSFAINDFHYDALVDSSGYATPIGGKVGEFLCEGQKLELNSEEFENGFIVTKDYGKIKIRFDSSLTGSPSFLLWLTPKHKVALKERCNPSPAPN